MSFTLRDATPADLPGILVIYNHIVETSTAIYLDDPVTLENRAAWLADRQGKGFPVLVAIGDGGQVLGYASYSEFRGAFPGYRLTVEHSVHVAEAARGMGLGKAMMRALLERAKAAGLHVMIGVIDAQNDISIRLHEKAGFRIVGRFDQIGTKFGRWLDVVFMQTEPGALA